MDLQELKNKINEGFATFKAFMEREIETDKDILNKEYFLDNADTTILNYLITLYPSEPSTQEGDKDLLPMIDYVLQNMADKNYRQPIHHAIRSGKVHLAKHLLGCGQSPTTVQNKQDKANGFSLKARDIDGRTLLSLALDSRDMQLITFLIESGVNLNESSLVHGQYMQPLHQAISSGLTEAVSLLINHNAQLNSVTGSGNDTPVLLASRLGKIDELEVILDTKQVDLTAENKQLSRKRILSHTALEECCELLKKSSMRADAIRGVAMLLCRGATLPRTDSACHLLSEYRSELVTAAKNYLEKHPELKNDFTARCHAKEKGAFDFGRIFYPPQTFIYGWHYVTARLNNAAFIIEDLTLSTAAEFNIDKSNDKLKYAKFVQTYTETFEQKFFHNPWSAMRWKIERGEANWQSVNDYAAKYPKSRTALVLKEMHSTDDEAHQELDEQSLVR